jgi:hypothetical protein
MSILKFIPYTVAILLLLLTQEASASHLYTMEISYRCLGNNQYVVQLETYRDCQGIGLGPGFNIRCSSSCAANLSFIIPLDTSYEVTPLCPSVQSTCNGGFTHGLECYKYKGIITLSPCPDWIISSDLCCRPTNNNTSNNAANYTSVSLNNTLGCNNSAELTAPLVIYSELGVRNLHYPQAYDIDGDSLVFELVNIQDNGISVPFLAGYSSSNPFGSGSPFSFDTNNGQFEYTTSNLGNYSIGLDIKEYRNGLLLTTSHREIVVYTLNNSSNNFNPEFTVSNVQGAVLKDNIFYVFDNDSITFDIIAIDSNATDNLSFESTIDTIGGSFTTIGNNPQTAGFHWNYSMTPIQEFMVEIKDNGCTSILGKQEFGFAIVQTRCLPDTITAIVAADSSYSIQVDCPWANSYIFSNIIAPTSPAFGSLSIDSSTNSVVYQAGSNVQVQDDFWLYYTVNNGQFQDSVWVEITTVSCVWAGDTDTNKVVNHFDILPLGLGFGQTGAIRPNADINYDCEPALNFANSTPVTGTNYKHADTDGSGLIDANDTAAIVQNWGLIHLKNNTNGSQTGIPFFINYEMAIPGQTLQIPIILGDSTVPADSIYGIAFSINYDQTLTDSNSVTVDFNTSWLGSTNTDLINIQKDFYNQGEIQIGVVRTDQTNRSGIGQIGSLNLTIKDDILKSNTQRLDLQISNVRIITNMETEKSSNTPLTDILISVANGQQTMKAKEVQLSVFPNPAFKHLFIRSNSVIEYIQLFNLAGQLVLEKEGNFSTQEIVNWQNLSAGIYFLNIQTSQQTIMQKISIED